MVHLLLVIIYISFISLGLPDGLLGAAWPSMYEELNVSVSYAGIISMIIAIGTVISSLIGERLVKKFGTGGITAISVGVTALALFGFSISNSFVTLCIWAIPYGLGAGSVDAALNNFVAVNYSSKHMSWLHCFWGVGCSIGPSIIAYCLASNKGWSSGYGLISLLQVVLTAMLLFSLPLWKKVSSKNNIEEVAQSNEIIGLRKTIKIKGVREVMIAFFAYCAAEQTAGLWAVSYVVLEKGISPEKAANWGALFYLGITAGRFIGGFLTMKFKDSQMVRIGQAILILGIITLFLPLGNTPAIVGLVLIGLGCAPIYPSLIHATPDNFGKSASQAVIGVQMASAYVGTSIMPSIFGFIADKIGIFLFPYYLLAIILIMIIMTESLTKTVEKVKY